MSTDPIKGAAELWDQLVTYQPATAAALTEKLRALPEDWPLRVFGVGRAGAALALAPAAPAAPEVPPWSDDWENCPACGEDGDLCRWHAGWAGGQAVEHAAVFQPMVKAVRTDPDVTVRALLQQLAEAESHLTGGDKR